MKKVLGTVFAIFIACAFLAAPASAMDDKWVVPHNDSGVSEMAIQVVKKIPFGEYDYVIAAFNPLTTIAGSGCTVDAGTTSFSTADPGWYVNGGVTLTPYSFKMNEVLTYWVTDSVGDIAPGSTDSGTSKYKFSWEKSSSGATAWMMKVYVMNSNSWVEAVTTSGGSLYCGDSRGTATLPVSTSTTFYATNQFGWGAGVTPYIHVLGKR